MNVISPRLFFCSILLLFFLLSCESPSDNQDHSTHDTDDDSAADDDQTDDDAGHPEPAPDELSPFQKLLLTDEWAIQSSAEIADSGAAISTPGYNGDQWFPTSIPSTVVSALVDNGVYPDPYFGMNLRTYPGMDYLIGFNFSNYPMLDGSPFKVSWWYRTEFALPVYPAGQKIWLNFNGINFRANLWLNGQLLADSTAVAGAYRRYEFDITEFAQQGESNSLALEIFAPGMFDLALTWVDWNPMPPDREMGLWQEVFIATSGPVSVKHPQVTTNFDLPSLDVAHLTVTAEVRNNTDQAVSGELFGRIENLKFSQPVDLLPHETRLVAFAPDAYSMLNLDQPRIWWPAQLGPQNLYLLNLRFETDGEVTDDQNLRFGIRQITDELTEQGYRLLKINGKNILIRGAGWADDLLLRVDPERQEAEIRYVRDLNLNTIRLEGKLANDHLLDLCDRYGIMVIAGWCCCDHWERWRIWNEEDDAVAAESLKSQILRLRTHASVIDWLNGSDNPPPPDVEQMYIDMLQALNWPNPYQSSATEKATSVTGLSGLKMRGPYEWIPPNYWLTDTDAGGAWGFATEIGPGPAVPPLESIQSMLPPEHYWPIDRFWDYHCGGGAFMNVDVFTKALNNRLGTAADLDDYLMKAQAMAYESHRAMFEAYGRNKYSATGVIQWMLNNAWPSMIWHLYDYYLRPGGSYFGAKKGCEPLHVQYSYDDQSIVVVNSFYKNFNGLRIKAEVFNLDLSSAYSNQATVDIGADSSTRVFTLPALQNLSTTYFLKLALEDAAGKELSDNFYWLSTKPDVLAWNRTTWYYTPAKSYADMTGLNSLPLVALNASAERESDEAEDTVRVSLENPTANLAFFIHLRVTQGAGGREVLPILWQDNYFSLSPGEQREITATYPTKKLEGADPVLALEAWNVSPFLVIID